ncbi:DUF1353 domain-containing protein [Campylobacter mucosalis]|uniref:Putative DUF1353 domain protein n=1 Tax=Campylobacter mucosalis CCUG 21559 TaxID=1032067 RepID=A0A6G5QGF1_9BACT|nr:DUF1353 domain-containing protein [Campylobacter mucosalis]QCD44123.1 putative DUF1353 domain protein [Campylobacter mucosalis CCUG 21559]QCD44712.1 putative DUF1353 domain protein [Campylobacter mucosalis CCUG 21559]
MSIHNPILKPFSKDKFELVEEYRYQDIIVPVGYKTNGANIPRIFWSVYPPNSPEYLSAILVHDYLCDLEKYELADEILKEMMTELGCSRLKVSIFYLCCRVYHKLRYRE